jgi:drug/metabolite transporter (DMT)-like permease
VEPGVLLGLGSAAAFGAGDFSGGFASRRVGVLTAAAGAQLAGLAVLLGILLAVRPTSPVLPSLVVAALAGVCGGLGLAALYRGLSRGSMGLVAALSGVGSVAIPVLVGAVLLGDGLSGRQLLGVAAAVAAGAMASGATRLGVNREALQMAAAAAVGFGLWFVLLDVAADDGELWALVASRTAAAVLLVSMALARRAGPAPRSAWPLIVAAGLLDVTGNAAFVLATGSVPVGIAAALSGLYPLVTMVLARVVLRDSLPSLGLAAVGVAVLGILLIGVG